MRKLFGTDGIRGVAGQYPLDADTVYRIGVALAHHLKNGGQARVRVVIGQDTRESSAWIADTLSAGLESAGAEVASAGVVTTPAIAYLARTQEFSAGVVISASHNPWTDNGIKIFGHDGFKLPDATEIEIEKEIFAQIQSGNVHGSIASNSLPGDHALAVAYEKWLSDSEKGTDFSRLKVVVDCANGAASAVAPELFRLCGISATFTHITPNGRNINQNCGALHPEIVAKEVVEQKADIGVCFDGDADRALFADHTGKVVNGDAVLLLTAREMKSNGGLAAETVIATTMSNMGLEAALKRSGIRMLRAPVGDKYVLEQMQKTGAVLGGEQSGHIIFSEQATTGDGLLTALKVLEIVTKSGKSLSDLVSDLKVFPQIIKNVRVREKKPMEQIPEVFAAIQAAEQDLKDEGRVVVRYSGTEALCRVMIEAASEEKMKRHVEDIAQAMTRAVGV